MIMEFICAITGMELTAVSAALVEAWQAVGLAGTGYCGIISGPLDAIFCCCSDMKPSLSC